MATWEEIRQGLEQQKKLEGVKNDLTPFGTALASGLWSIPGLIGVEPPMDVQKAQAENPLSALGGELLGMAVPYGGWAKASTKIPSLVRAMDKAEDLGSTALSRGALREATRWAPFELGRVALTPTLGKGIAEGADLGYSGVGDVAATAAIDLGIAAGLGAAGGAWRAYGKTRRREALEPGANPIDPPQLKLRAIKQSIPQVDPGRMDEVLARANELKREVRLGTRPKKAKYAESRKIATLFPVRKTKALDIRQLDDSTVENFDEIVTAHMPKDWELFAQYPRLVTSTTKGGTERIRAAWRELPGTAGQFRYGRDGDGLWVMMKRLSGETGKATDAEQYLTWKTDDPGKFLPSTSKWAQKMLDRNVWLRDLPQVKPIGDPVYDEFAGLWRSLQVKDLRAMAETKGNVRRLTDKFLESTGQSGAPSDVRLRAGKFVKEYIAPSMFRYSNPLTHRLRAVARSTYDRAESRAEELIFGKPHLGEGSLIRDIAASGAKHPPGSIASMVDNLDEEGMAQLWRAWREGLGLDEVIEMGMKPAALRLYKKLQDTDIERLGQLNKVRGEVGLKPFEGLENHLMISRTWKGEHRAPVFNGKRLVYVGAGDSRSAAIKEAERFIKGSGNKSSLHIDQVGVADFKKDQELLRKLANDEKLVERKALAPVTFKGRRGIGGYVGEETPWTKKELKQNLLRNVRGMERYKAQLAIENQLKHEFDQLLLTDPFEARMLDRELRLLRGEQGPVSEWQNRVMDKMLSPVLGKDSASKIVSTMNKVMFDLTLGFFNLGYGMANLLTFTQTSLPHLAWLSTASPERIAQYYSFYPIVGRQAVKSLGVFDVMKMTKQSFVELGRPSPALKAAFERGARDGVWDPRFIEDFLGENSQMVTKLRDVLKGEAGFVSWLHEISKIVPSFTEKFSRGHTFTLGYIYGRDMLNLSDDALYRFAKEFTEKTQFMYSAADRAAVITGPFGSAVGLFKNWMMHYIGWWMEYTGEGLSRGNWKPLLWATGGTTAVGGIGAMPFYSELDKVSEWMTDKKIMQHTYDLFGEGADPIFYGVPGMLGFSIQNQTAAPFSNLSSDVSYLFSMAYMDRARAAGNALGDAVDHWDATGEHPIKDADTRDALVRAFAPKAVYRAMASDVPGQIRSLHTGYPMISDLSLGEQALYVFGLNPTAVEKAYAVNQALWEDQNAMREKVAAYGDAWADSAGDSDTRRLIIKKAVAEGVPVDSILRSAQSRAFKAREDMLQRQFDPSGLREWSSVIRTGE